MTIVTKFEFADTVLNVGDKTTLTIEFSNPVTDLTSNDFFLKGSGIVLSNPQPSSGMNSTYVLDVEAVSSGSPIVSLQALAVMDNNFNLVPSNPIEAKAVTIAPVVVLEPTITLPDPGSDSIYNLDDVTSNNKVPVIIEVPAEAKLGDTLIVNNTQVAITPTIKSSGYLYEAEPNEVVTAAIKNISGTGNAVVETVYDADLIAPDAPSVTLDQDLNGDGVIDYVELNGNTDSDIEFTVDVGNAEVDDVLMIGNQEIKITPDIIANGYQTSLPAVNGNVDITATVVDKAGNKSTATVTTPDVDLTIPNADPIYLWHLGANLTDTQGPSDARGKTGGEYGDNIEYSTGILNDSVYIGYKGVDSDGNLIVSPWDGDFERDSQDGDAVWNLETYAGNDLVYIREDQNAYTAAKLGSGDDTLYAQGEMDSVLGVAQENPNARSYIYAESGNDTVVIGGNGEGKVTGWGIDGGRIFMGSGSDDVTVYGEADDGAVIDLGAGMSTYANPVDVAAATTVDVAGDVNNLTITRNLGNAGDIDFGHVFGGAGNDNVSVGTYVEGSSIIDLGEGTNTVTIGDDLDGNARVVTGSGDDKLTIGDDTEDYAVVNLGDGNNEIAIDSTVEDHSTITTGEGDDTLTVGYAIANYTTVDLGNGDNQITVGDDVDGYSKVTTGSGNDTLVIGDDTEDGSVIDLGDGNNTITVDSTVEDSSTIKTGSGDDTLTVGYAIANNATVNLGNGNNTITTGDDIDGNAEVITGDGNDTVTVNDDIEDNSVVNLGDGDNTITVADNVEDNASVITGSGNDVITIGGISGSASIDAGAGDDTIVFTGKNAGGSINGGIGTDTLQLTFDADNSLVNSNSHVTNLSTEDISGIEVVELNGLNAFDIRYEDLVQDTDRDGALFIHGDSDSKVDLGSTNWNSDDVSKAKFDDTSVDGTWTKSSTAEIAGVDYDIYHNSFATDTSNDVYIEQGIVVI